MVGLAVSETIRVFRSSLQCSHTMECGYAVSSMFIPGDRHALIGTKVCLSGWLCIIDCH